MSCAATANSLRLRGVTTVVPKGEVLNAQIDGALEASKVTGVVARRWVRSVYDQKDMELFAAQKLLIELGWEPSSVTTLIHVTQTPYVDVPAGAYELHDKLELPRNCAVVPVNWSCSGYVMGLWLAGQLMGVNSSARTLLVVGDSTSTICDPADRATRPLFGDAVSATALDLWRVPVHTQKFTVGSDGRGAEHLRADLSHTLSMNGAEVLQFVLRNVPHMARELLDRPGADYVLLHQANKMMIDALRRKIVADCGLRTEQIPCNIEKFGNCSSASIPLLVTSLFSGARPRALDLALLGFGAGWAWAGARLTLPQDCYVEGFEL